MTYLEDTDLFPVLQAGVFMSALFVALKWHWIDIKRYFKSRVKGSNEPCIRISCGEAGFQVTRTPQSIQTLYGTCAAVLGAIVTVDWAVDADIAKHYRVFWMSVDIVQVMYICLFNPIARNLILLWPEYLRKIERR